MNCQVADEITKTDNIANGKLRDQLTEEFSGFCFNYFFLSSSLID